MKIESRIPLEYKTAQSAGFDLPAYLGRLPDAELLLAPGTTLTVPTGVRILEMHALAFGMVCSRSGFASKNSIAVLNAPGIIDADYKDEIQVILHNFSDKVFAIRNGMRIAQMVFGMFFQAQEIKVGGMRNGGLGSTGE